MKSNRILTVYLPNEYIEYMDMLVNVGFYTSRSEIMRHAVRSEVERSLDMMRDMEDWSNELPKKVMGVYKDHFNSKVRDGTRRNRYTFVRASNLSQKAKMYFDKKIKKFVDDPDNFDEKIYWEVDDDYGK